MSGKLDLQPTRRRFGFEAMDLANSSRTLDNDYLTWLRGEAPARTAGRWPMGRPRTDGSDVRRICRRRRRRRSGRCREQSTFLRGRDPTAPFFLNVSFMDPHPPFTPPAFFFDRYERIGPAGTGDWRLGAALPRGPRRGMDPELSEHTERWSRRLHLDPGADCTTAGRAITGW